MGISSAAYLIVFSLLVGLARAQTAPSPRVNQTDPAEARAINSIFSKWGITGNSTAQGWNISGEPCSGTAMYSTPIAPFTSGMRCECIDSVCHITDLAIYKLDVQGVIPDELWTLTHLKKLSLNPNYLTGPLSPGVGNLTRLQYLDVSVNALSGKLPKELGRLTDLRSLGFGTNNFNGPLPPEIGNCTRLEQIFLDSSGVSGEIPPTFANLRNTRILWAFDNQFTGRIPDFIGDWTKLETLRIHGNSFEGPIPHTFSGLTALKELRISDLSNGTSSLDFLDNLKNLTILVLRNNNISGTIPSNIGEYENLERIDLSFNNLTGQIPSALFNLRGLQALFLGNNNLTGTLPAEKSANLQIIDLSYNGLSGSFPSWVHDTGLNLNLVANDFRLGNSYNSTLPSGLNCLQRNFMCNRDKGIQVFGINSGGERFTGYNGLVYEMDDNALGPATYYTSSTEDWAVSNVGLSDDNIMYRDVSPIAFSNTFDPTLFQTVRLSAGSLRYYGLGLQNGNYTVTLHLVELAIGNGPTWRSLGRRIFDIYIQGNLVEKDFDIKREAGGASLQPVRKVYPAWVSENYLEIHLFWAGKGTCCVPTLGFGGPSISAVSAVLTKYRPNSTNKRSTDLIVGIIIPVAVVSVLSLLALYFFLRRRRYERSLEVEEEFRKLDAKPYTSA